MSPFDRFIAAHPDRAADTALSGLRSREYGRLDASKQVYLDYTGGGLHAASQVREHADMLADNMEAQADNIDALADNTSNASAAAALENVADNTTAAADNVRDAAEAKADNM